jgi:hypothetical protein
LSQRLWRFDQHGLPPVAESVDELVWMMLCATLLVAGQCAFTCGGDLDEFRKAWNIRWHNGAQAVVDNYGPVAPLRRVNGHVIWAVEAEPASCTPVPKLKPRIEETTAERPKP